MKFGKLFEYTLIEDWKEHYLQYEDLKNLLSEIRKKFLKGIISTLLTRYRSKKKRKSNFPFSTKGKGGGFRGRKRE
jgi:SPX domain protein involved in polyphosphate accumulation